MTFTGVRGTVATASAAWLMVVCSLVLWSLAPMALGWKASVVTTGSMLPDVKPGDVVLVDPAGTPKRGSVVLVNDPDVPTGRVAHRVVAVNADGTPTTKGDANPTQDSTRRARADVVGVARLLVPTAGRLALLRTQPTRDVQVWAAITLIAALTFAFTHRPAARDPRH
jgi:signal peptidase